MASSSLPELQAKINGSRGIQWRPVVGYEGRYEVSSCGRVRSLVGVEPAELKQTVNGGGYPSVRLCNGAVRTVYTHHIVAEAFHGPRPAGHDIHHVNGIRTDNHASNLQYLSRREHARAHARKRGRQIAKRMARIGGAE